MNARLAALALCAALLTGCAALPSLHPLYTDADQTLDPALVGTWVDDEGKELLRVQQPQSGPAYEVVFLDESFDKTSFEARLVELGAFRFLDIAETEAAIPSHFFARISLKDGKASLSMLGSEWLEQQIAKDPSAPAHDRIDKGQMILTGPTADLRKFVVKYANEPQAWETTAFRRLR